VRRRAPRPLAAALEAVARDAAPPGLLARVQSVWEEVAGAAVAAEARPVSERAGTVTVACDSAVWAYELGLLGPDLARRLNAVLGEEGVVSLRFKAGL
jgi:predicted nucleic acid-binding Zn ribbon protein